MSDTRDARLVKGGHTSLCPLGVGSAPANGGGQEGSGAGVGWSAAAYHHHGGPRGAPGNSLINWTDEVNAQTIGLGDVFAVFVRW